MLSCVVPQPLVGSFDMCFGFRYRCSVGRTSCLEALEIAMRIHALHTSVEQSAMMMLSKLCHSVMVC